MKTFLEYVAEDILKKYGTDMSRIAVVFPNKRAALFLNSYLAQLAGQPIWSPSYITISDLFCRHSDLTVGDQIKLICDLHKSFTQQTGIDETLDHFYGWGQLLLSDFDDIDKNMADANQVFSNLRDIHELDDISYLTQQQKDMIKKFFSNFTDNHNTELKRRFFQLWSHIGDIFNNYKQRLKSQGIAYEGMLFREVAENKDIDFHYDTYLFVGFNLLQKVEQTIFSQLTKQGKAHFYWDFDKYYMDGKNEAGHYIRTYLEHFPNELDNHDDNLYNNLSKPKEITYISAPTENIQARYISQWLKDNDRITAGKRTVIVMCDEGLLQTVVHCLPEDVNEVNITTGYPLSQSPICSLIAHLISLQTNGYVPSSDSFRLHYVRKVLNHPYSRFISQNSRKISDTLMSNKVYFPNHKDFATDETLASLFIPTNNNNELLSWLLMIVKTIAINAGTKDQLMQESLFRTYTLLNRLKDIVASGDLVVDVITLQRLIKQVIGSTTVPFHGEPAAGIQVMGVLETRNLDFDHVLILSCNEGNMPKGISDSSFIPYSIRKAYGLTTVDNKVDIFAYHFHRILQRAKDVTILYNNSTEDGHTGEMSRFMLQLIVESNHDIGRKSLKSGQEQTILTPKAIEKDETIMDRLRNTHYLSPTAINRYLRCPLQFYYNNIAGICESEENEDDEIDNRIFGNIFHKATELIYSRFSGIIRQGDIEELLKQPVEIELIVDRAFREELFNIKDNRPFQMHLNGLQIINREVIIRYVRRLLELDMRIAPFTILGTEHKVEGDIAIRTSEGERTITVGGWIDRLDLITDNDICQERMRVVDYKTGSKALTRKVSEIAEIFDPMSIRDKHSDYYLQTMLYSMLVRNNSKYNSEKLPVSPALLFIQHTAGDNYDPTLFIGNDKITDINDYFDEFNAGVSRIVSDIYEPTLPFAPTEDKRNCALCPYKMICGI